MKKLFATTMLVAITAGSAYAADIAVRPYIKAPAVGRSYNWTGFYMGVNGGGALGDSAGRFNTSSDPTFFTDIGGFNPFDLRAKHEGGFGGAQAGYNMQFGVWLVGLEADIHGADIGKNAVVIFPGSGASVPSTTTSRDHLDWFGTVRGRVGYAADRVLFYGTGGLAYGGADSSFSTVASPLPNETTIGSSSGTRIGWAAGAGIEWAFAASWTLKGEYLHLDLGHTDVVGTFLPTPINTITYRFDHQIDTVRIGVNYKFDGLVIAKY